MKNTSAHHARSTRRALLGGLAILASSALASPAGADPNFLYSTYLGGSLNDGGTAVAARGGTTYVAGLTFSTDFPVVRVSSQKPNGTDVPDVFVTRFSPSGVPLYSTYVPTSPDRKLVLGIVAAPDGSAYVGAVTLYGSDASTEIVKLNPSGTVAWSRELFGRVYAQGMAVDSQGSVYVTGRNNSDDFTNGGYVDFAFVVKFLPDGTMGYSAAIDGNNYESGYAIAVNDAGYAYVTGLTLSTNLPNALQAVPGGLNAFLLQLDPSGAVLWSTYLGGSGEDWGRKIALAPDGTVVVGGTTTSADFPTGPKAIQTTLNGPQDVLVARFQPWGSRLSSTYAGGSGTDELKDLAVDDSGILLAVSSPGSDSPLRAPLPAGCTTTFIAKLDAAASRVLDASCGGVAVAADSTGVSVTGSASSGLPVVNAWQPSPKGGTDAFAQKLTFNHPPSCATASASPGTLWPADGRFVPVAIAGVTDPEGDAVTIAVTSIFQDEFLTNPSAPDGSGVGTPTASLRASRISGGNGRVYHVGFTATDPRGAACAGSVTVCVPPTQGGTCVDGGARVDSTRSY